MKYKFLGKPDKRFPFLKTGKVYDLSIKEEQTFREWVAGVTHPVIEKPFRCPYTSWKTFYQNWLSTPPQSEEETK